MKQMAHGKMVSNGSFLKSQDKVHLQRKVNKTLQNATMNRIDSYIDELLNLIKSLKQNDELDLVLLVRASKCLYF